MLLSAVIYFFIKLKKINYSPLLVLVVLGLCCRVGFSPVVGGGGCSPVTALGLLIPVAFLVLEQEI